MLSSSIILRAPPFTTIKLIMANANNNNIGRNTSAIIRSFVEDGALSRAIEQRQFFPVNLLDMLVSIPITGGCVFFSLVRVLYVIHDI